MMVSQPISKVERWKLRPEINPDLTEDASVSRRW